MTNFDWISLGFSLLIGSGGLGVVLKYGIRLAVLERLFEDKQMVIRKVETNQEGMSTRLTAVESAILEFRSIIPELSKVASIGVKLDLLVQAITDAVPRRELEARLEALDSKMQNL